MKSELKKGKAPGVYILKGVTLIYPSLFTPSIYAGDLDRKGNPRYVCEITFDKNSPLATELPKLLKDFGKEVHGKHNFKTYLLDGDDQRDIDHALMSEPKPHRMGKLYTKIRCPHDRPPAIYSKDGRLVEQDDGEVFSGCRANVFITLWAGGEASRKCCIMSLIGIQVREGGTRLKGVDSPDLLDDIEKGEETKAIENKELELEF